MICVWHDLPTVVRVHQLMVNVLWGSLPIIGLSFVTFSGMGKSVSPPEWVSVPGYRDEVVSTSSHRNRTSDVFEPREDNEGQPQETVG